MPDNPLPIDHILDAPYPAVRSLDIDVSIDLVGVRATSGRLDLDLDREAAPAIVRGDGSWEDAMAALQASQGVVPGRLIDDGEFGVVQGVRDEEPRDVALRGCLCGPANFGPGGMRAKVEFQSVEVGTPPTDAPVIASCVLRGFTLDLWPVYRKQGDRHRLEIFNTTILGEPVVVRQLDDEHARLIFLEQRPYDGRQAADHPELWQWLSFVVGRPIEVVQEEAFTLEGRHVFSRTYPVPRHPLQRAMPPVPLDPMQDQGRETVLRLEEIVSEGYAAFREWCERIFLLEAVHHLHSGVRAHLESRFAMYAIAFETLASSFARYQGGDVQASAHYFDRPTFRKVIKAARKAFKNAFLEHREGLEDPDAVFATMDGKLCAINERAMQDRFRTLLDALDLVPTEAELAVLARRNAAIHEGVLGRDRDALDVQDIVDAENTLLTLLHKIVLRLAGYEGPIVDYGAEGYPTVDLAASMAEHEADTDEPNPETDE